MLSTNIYDFLPLLPFRRFHQVVNFNVPFVETRKFLTDMVKKRNVWKKP